MPLTVDKVDDVAVVTVNLDEFDAGNADDFKQEIAPVLQTCSRVVLDLNRVRFVDSSGCGAILSVLKNVTSARRRPQAVPHPAPRPHHVRADPPSSDL